MRRVPCALREPFALAPEDAMRNTTHDAVTFTAAVRGALLPVAR